MKQYNINELLEKKKELENQIRDKVSGFSQEDLTYIKTEVIDYVNDGKFNKTHETRERITLGDFTRQVFGMSEELAKIKVAIQKHNANTVADLLQNREALRTKYKMLNNILMQMPKNKQVSRQASRTGKDGRTEEIMETTNEPMFERKAVEKQMNEVAAQERKANTEIQKLNLDAVISIEEPVVEAPVQQPVAEEPRLEAGPAQQ